MYMGFLFCHS